MRAVVVIPTFNERDNIAPLIRRLTALVGPGAPGGLPGLPMPLDLFFVDDNSPDGTGQLLESMRPEIGNLRVLHRSGKLGLGTAYRTAFHQLLAEGYDRLLSMDADLSHAPESIPALLAASEEADLVVGSRYVAGGGTQHCSAARRALSRTANAGARLLLGLTLRDATAGFRCYRRELLADLDRRDIRSNGYSYLLEMSYNAQRLGYRLAEVPIRFDNRVHEKSKMSRKEIWLASRTLLRLAGNRLFSGARREHRVPG
ncbi:MAG TPA: polyprenol monophosphomannose synthase [Thermoanaerobaculia bacterium]|jgi:glycosyltransferase involved in cell wall biosynthesis|nr:polyprenol monophosphomannose synthase [Thermoanaerobaculia bacterium]